MAASKKFWSGCRRVARDRVIAGAAKGKYKGLEETLLAYASAYSACKRSPLAPGERLSPRIIEAMEAAEAAEAAEVAESMAASEEHKYDEVFGLGRTRGGRSRRGR